MPRSTQSDFGVPSAKTQWRTSRRKVKKNNFNLKDLFVKYFKFFKLYFNSLLKEGNKGIKEIRK